MHTYQLNLKLHTTLYLSTYWQFCHFDTGISWTQLQAMTLICDKFSWISKHRYTFTYMSYNSVVSFLNHSTNLHTLALMWTVWWLIERGDKKVLCGWWRGNMREGGEHLAQLMQGMWFQLCSTPPLPFFWSKTIV
jgi:hypothetical protein